MEFFNKLKEHKVNRKLKDGTVLRAIISIDNHDTNNGDKNDKGRFWKLVFDGVGEHQGVRLYKHLYSEHSSDFTVQNSMDDIKNILSSHYNTSVTDAENVIEGIKDLIGLTVCIEKSSFKTTKEGREYVFDTVGKILVNGDEGYFKPFE